MVGYDNSGQRWLAALHTRYDTSVSISVAVCRVVRREYPARYFRVARGCSSISPRLGSVLLAGALMSSSAPGV